LWALELQALYGDDNEPFVNILADTSFILCKLSLWAALVATVVTSSALLLRRDALDNANEFTQSKRLFFLPKVSLRSTRAAATATTGHEACRFTRAAVVSSSFSLERKLFLCER
jgi:hypothetical protein